MPRNPPPAFTVSHRTHRLFIALAALLVTAPAALDAQVRRGRQAAEDDAPPWAPIAVGVKAGWDSQANGEILGAHLHIPVVRSGSIELYPSAEMTFLLQGKEYQYNLDAAWVPGGARGGVFGGGGVGWRRTAIEVTPGDPLETFIGLNAFGGGKTAIGPLQIEFLIRWTFLQDTQYRPNSASIGLNLPLWGTGQQR